MGEFNLADLLNNVPDLGTGREQIEYIPLDLIDDDAKNFYSTDEIESLARNIATVGLLDPLRIRDNSDSEGRYKVVSGHRRRLALKLLAQDDPERWGEVACIHDQMTFSPTMQQLRLIFANSDNRKKSDADISEEAVQVEQLLYKLKEEEGYEFPGRMRDHVSEVVGVSKSKLARLKVIREKLILEWNRPWETDKIGESVAYALAQLPSAWQRLIFAGCSDPKFLYESTVQEYAKRFKEIEAMACGDKKDRVCPHKTTMMEKSCKNRWNDPCKSRCCWNCISLRTCKDSCSAAAGKKKDLRESHKAEAAAEAQRIADRDRPDIEKVDALWQRFGLARELAMKDWPDCKKVMGISYFQLDDEKVMKLECGEAKVTPDTKLPYWASRCEVDQLTALADYLDCSIDYLFCRTDIREMAERKAVSELGTIWRIGEPEAPGTYAAYVQVADADKKMLRELLWDGEEWFLFGDRIADDVKVCCWVEQPGEA